MALLRQRCDVLHHARTRVTPPAVAATTAAWEASCSSGGSGDEGKRRCLLLVQARRTLQRPRAHPATLQRPRECSVDYFFTILIFFETLFSDRAKTDASRRLFFYNTNFVEGQYFSERTLPHN